MLVSEGVIADIIRTADISYDDLVVEVGPGTGIMTRRVLEIAQHVVAVEIDDVMVSELQGLLSENENFTLIHGDILSQSPDELSGGQPYIVVANLPYNIASPTIRLFLESDHPPQRMVVMVQREVAQQMTALPGKASLLTIATQVFANARITRRVRPGSFVPPPAVDSAVVRLDVHAEPRVSPDQQPQFFQAVRAGFAAPRKQLRNSLAIGLGLDTRAVDAALSAVGIDGRRRPQTLTIDEWAPIGLVLKRFFANREQGREQ